MITVSFEYLFAGLFALIVFVFLFIKIRYPFWNIQPVLHTYSRWFTWSSEPYIAHMFPHRTKYVVSDPLLMTTSRYEQLSADDRKSVIHLLQSNYIPSDRIFSSIEDSALRPHFVGKSMVTIMKTPVYVTGAHDASASYSSTISFVSSRGVKVWTKTKGTEIDAYFFDYFCLYRHIKNAKTAAYQLFQTHEWNQRISDRNVHVSAFRKDVNLCDGVVPLVKFKSATFALRNLKIEALPDGFQLKLVRANSNMHFVHDFIDMFGSGQLNSAFDAAIYIEKPAIYELVLTRQLFIGALVKKDQLFGLYFVKNANIKYDELEDVSHAGGDTLHLVASFRNTELDGLFYLGFLHFMREIMKDRSTTFVSGNKEKPNRVQATKERFGIIMMDAIGHSIAIVDQWNAQHAAMVNVDSAYYLYNYLWSGAPVHPGNGFFLL